MKLKNTEINIGDLGEERKFVSGTKYWFIEWAKISNEKFKTGDKVMFIDEDTDETFIGKIDWMIVTETGNVEVSIADTALGRVDLEDIEHI